MYLHFSVWSICPASQSKYVLWNALQLKLETRTRTLLVCLYLSVLEVLVLCFKVTKQPVFNHQQHGCIWWSEIWFRVSSPPSGRSCNDCGDRLTHQVSILNCSILWFMAHEQIPSGIFSRLKFLEWPLEAGSKTCFQPVFFFVSS